MTDTPAAKPTDAPIGATAVLALADGTLFWGQGFGAVGEKVGEVCFNTAMTGYQEIMTDPSYAGQIITFTFPHIGNVGANIEDVEATTPYALGCIMREPITPAANFRAEQGFDDWLRSYGLIGIAGVDTRRLTRYIRTNGAPSGVLAHNPEGRFDVEALIAKARAWSGLEGLDLAKEVWTRQTYHADELPWRLGHGYGKQANPTKHVVAVDFGIKRNILRNLASTGAKITVVPGDATFEEIMSLNPDGVFLSNGPGDPAATGEYAVPVIRKLLETGKPVFGICLGHQLLGLAAGAKTFKMHQGHRGANHPVKDLETGKVEITVMNHGFSIDPKSLPANVEQTHVSLFDGTLCGLRYTDRPVFSVQHHPEASPGSQDSNHLFRQFMALMEG